MNNFNVLCSLTLQFRNWGFLLCILMFTYTRDDALFHLCWRVLCTPSRVLGKLLRELGSQLESNCKSSLTSAAQRKHLLINPSFNISLVRSDRALILVGFSTNPNLLPSCSLAEAFEASFFVFRFLLGEAEAFAFSLFELCGLMFSKS